MDLKDDTQGMLEDLVTIRRDLHSDPEIGLDLPRTQERVLAALQGLPLELHTGEEATSVTAILRGGQRSVDQTTTVLLRGDMDALPIKEQVAACYASRNGAMHACGHDLHTSALIGAAKLLSLHRDALHGDVVFMFQPGEEGYDGAAVMISEGVLNAAGKKADYAYGLHVTSNRLETGLFASRPGTVMSAVHNLYVTVHGTGGHGSAPHTAKDPVIAAAEMIAALQRMITRGFDIFDPVVVTVGAMNAGTRNNIIPDTATFDATVRSFSPEAAEKLDVMIPRVLSGLAASHGVEVDINFAAEYPVTVNNVDETAFSQQVVQNLFGEERYLEMPNPVSGSEDFSRVLAEVPGTFLFLGACPPDVDVTLAPANHSPRAEFDDRVLGDAAAAYSALALQRLQLASA